MTCLNLKCDCLVSDECNDAATPLTEQQLSSNSEEVKCSSSQKCSLILVRSVFSLDTKEQSDTSASFVYFYVR